jgi:hypothetical protein
MSLTSSGRFHCWWRGFFKENMQASSCKFEVSGWFSVRSQRNPYLTRRKEQWSFSAWDLKEQMLPWMFRENQRIYESVSFEKERKSGSKLVRLRRLSSSLLLLYQESVLSQPQKALKILERQTYLQKIQSFFQCLFSVTAIFSVLWFHD